MIIDVYGGQDFCKLACIASSAQDGVISGDGQQNEAISSLDEAT